MGEENESAWIGTNGSETETESTFQRSTIETTGYMDITAIKRQRLKAYLIAEEKILRGQSYTLDNRTLTRANLSEVRKVIDELIAEIALAESNKNGNVRRAVFID